MLRESLFTLCFAVLAGATPARAALPYLVTQIPSPSGGLHNVMDINEVGHVTYWGGSYKAYIWDGAAVTYLPGSGPYRNSIAYMLNDADVAVGSINSGYYSKAARWVGGVLEVLDLGSLNSTDSVAYAVNNAGLIAGRSVLSGSGRHLFTISPDGTVTDHGLLPSSHQYIREMNESGQIVMLDSGAEIKGYVWEAGTYTPLYDLEGGIFSAPYGINEAGLVVGMSWPYQANAKAVVWQDGQIVRILPAPEGTTDSCAYDVNNLGQIVGYYETQGLGTRACLWDADGAFYDLADLVVQGPAGRLDYARDINDAGQIAVLGSNATGYLMTPIPEPATLALLAIGGLALIRRRKRHAFA